MKHKFQQPKAQIKITIDRTAPTKNNQFFYKYFLNFLEFPKTTTTILRCFFLVRVWVLFQRKVCSYSSSSTVRRFQKYVASISGTSKYRSRNVGQSVRYTIHAQNTPCQEETSGFLATDPVPSLCNRTHFYTSPSRRNTPHSKIKPS